MKKKIYKTIIQFEVLSETEIESTETLESILKKCDTEQYCGIFRPIQLNKPLKGLKAVKEVLEMNQDVDFFNMDLLGNDLSSKTEKNDENNLPPIFNIK